VRRSQRFELRNHDARWIFKTRRVGTRDFVARPDIFGRPGRSESELANIDRRRYSRRSDQEGRHALGLGIE
jgi:hypothetical protein